MGGRRNILLKLLADPSDAKRGIGDVRQEIQRFDGTEADARLKIRKEGVEEAIEKVKARLANLSKQEATPRVKIAMARAVEQLDRLELKLDKLDHKDVTVDVDVRRGALKRIGAAISGAAMATLPGGALAAAGSEGGGGVAKTIAGLAPSIGGLGPAASGAAAVIGGALVAAVSALAASAASALAGVAALGTALVGAFGPVAVLAAGAVARFKEMSAVAGSAANGLKKAAGGFVDAFRSATAGGADAIFRGLAGALRTLTPLLARLRPAFSTLGRAIGAAFGTLAQAFSRPAIAAGFTKLLDGAAQLAGPAAKAVAALGEILLNIATAAMPFLVKGFEAMGKALDGLAGKTRDASGLSNVIGGLVDQLRSWLALGGQVAGVFLSFFKIAAPDGKSLVDSLTRGAASLRKWLDSAKGQERVKQFFHDVLPLVHAVAQLVGRLTVVFLQFVQFAAPALTRMVRAMSVIVGVVSKLLDALLKLPDGFKTAILDPLGAIRGPALSAAHAIAHGIGAAFGGIKGVVKAALGGVVGVVRGTINTVISVLDGFIKAVNKITPGKIHIPGPLPDIPGVPDIPLIPKLAQGGVARRATLGIFGEAGPEAILPLSGAVLGHLAAALSARITPEIIKSTLGVNRLQALGAGGISPHVVFAGAGGASTSIGQQHNGDRNTHFHINAGQRPVRDLLDEMEREISRAGG